MRLFLKSIPITTQVGLIQRASQRYTSSTNKFEKTRFQEVEIFLDENIRQEDSFLEREDGALEEIESGIMIRNLPPKIKKTLNNELESQDEFPADQLEKYKCSTMSYVSKVDPRNTVGVGIAPGAFGALEDKRFGFLRPRKEFLQKKEQTEVALDAAIKSGRALTPEEKRVAKQRDIRRKQEEFAAAMKMIKQHEGTTFSPYEHFLLTELDFEKDSLLFGHTREDFEDNVKKMKSIIIEYSKWERKEKQYRYTTWFMKLFFCYACYDTWASWRIKNILKNSFEDFADTLTEEIQNLKNKREADFEVARQELTMHPPIFSKLEAKIEIAKQVISSKMDEPITMNSSNSNIVPVKKYHPMDTFHIQQEEDEKKYIKVRDNLSMNITLLNETQHDGQKPKSSDLSSLAKAGRFVKNIMSFQGYRHSNTLSQAAVVQELHLDKKSKKPSLPNKKVNLENDELIKQMGYEIAPTSIEFVRSLRRILLSRSTDYTYIVRQEMRDYKKKKLEQMRYPHVPQMLNKA